MIGLVQTQADEMATDLNSQSFSVGQENRFSALPFNKIVMDKIKARCLTMLGVEALSFREFSIRIDKEIEAEGLPSALKPDFEYFRHAVLGLLEDQEIGYGPDGKLNLTSSLTHEPEIIR